MRLCLLLFFSLILFGAFAQLSVHDSAPLQNLDMVGLDGESHNLTHFKKENGLVVIFSCNSCPFVIGSDDFMGWESQYNSLYDIAVENKIGLVLINSNEGKRDNVDSYEEMILHAKNQNYKMPYLLDKGAALADAFGAKTTPHVYFFDNSFQLIYVGSIDNTWDKARKTTENYLSNAITSKGKGKNIKPNQTPPKGCGIKRTTTIKN